MKILPASSFHYFVGGTNTAQVQSYQYREYIHETSQMIHVSNTYQSVLHIRKRIQMEVVVIRVMSVNTSSPVL